MPVPMPGSSLCRAVQASMATSFDYNQTDTSNLNLWRGLGYWIQPLFLSRSQSVNSPVSVIRQDLQETRNSALKCGKNSLILAWSLGLIHTLWRSISILQKEPTQWCSIIKHFLNLAIWPTVQMEQHRFVFKQFYCIFSLNISSWDVDELNIYFFSFFYRVPFCMLIMDKQGILSPCKT